jgi:hypothetical protein
LILDVDDAMYNRRLDQGKWADCQGGAYGIHMHHHVMITAMLGCNEPIHAWVAVMTWMP